MQQERLRNPYPWTFEIPLALLLLFLLTTVLGLHAGRGLANLFSGGGWAWPPSSTLFTSLPGLLRGDAAAGLTDPGVTAGPGALRAWLVITQVLQLAAWCVLSAFAFRRWGPGRIRGMATRAQANALLGLPRLRKHRAIIRPDLYGKQAP